MIDEGPNENHENPDGSPAEDWLFKKLKAEKDEIENASSASISSLETKVQRLEDQLSEYKFAAIFIAIFTLDCWLFSRFTTTAAIVCLFVLELIALFILAKRLRIEEIDIIADRVSNIFSKQK